MAPTSSMASPTGALAGISSLGYAYTQTRYYVGFDGGQVAIPNDATNQARALLELYEVIDAAVEIGLPMMQTGFISMLGDWLQFLRSITGSG